MSAIKEWISPLPDKSLPALRIREELLRILMEVCTHLSGRRLSGIRLRSASHVRSFSYSCPEWVRRPWSTAASDALSCICTNIPKSLDQTKTSRWSSSVRSRFVLLMLFINHSCSFVWFATAKNHLTVAQNHVFRWSVCSPSAGRTDNRSLSLCRWVVATDLWTVIQLQGDDERGASAERSGPADASETAAQVPTTRLWWLSQAVC